MPPKAVLWSGASGMKTYLWLLAADVTARQHTRSYSQRQSSHRQDQVHHIHGQAGLERDIGA